jgi:hypothetical protein
MARQTADLEDEFETEYESELETEYESEWEDEWEEEGESEGEYEDESAVPAGRGGGAAGRKPCPRRRIQSWKPTTGWRSTATGSAASSTSWNSR